MTDQDNSYRPRSPDFSNLASVPSASFSDAYNPSPYTSAGPFTPQASYDASPFFNPHIQQQQQPQPQQPQQQQQHHPQQQPYQPQRQHYPHHQYPTQPYIPQPYSPVSEMPPQTRSRTQHAQQSQAQPPFSRHSSHEHYPQYQPPELPHEQQLPHHRQQQEPEQPQHHEPQPPYPEPQQPTQPLPEEASPDEKIPITAVSSSGPSAGIEVRTKFPVARIKRIMQADEDVGKVAQVTPIAVSKALELFMISLVTKAAQQAKDRSSKRITAGHLKEAIAKDEVLDFLADIISKVPDQAHRKQDDDNSDQNEAPKKKGGRRKKEEPDDDF